MALCQLAVSDDKQQNILRAQTAITEAARGGAQLVVLPEMWNCPYSNDSFPAYAEDVEGGFSPSADMLSAAAAANRVTVVGGSIPERAAGKLFNTCFVYGTDGALLGRHRKVGGRGPRGAHGVARYASTMQCTLSLQERCWHSRASSGLPLCQRRGLGVTQRPRRQPGAPSPAPASPAPRPGAPL